MSRVEQPQYKVIASDGTIEVREYGYMIAAASDDRVLSERCASVAPMRNYERTRMYACGLWPMLTAIPVQRRGSRQ